MALALCVAAAHAAEPLARNALPPAAQVGNYVGHDVMIPMRDGTQLHAEVWRPKNVTTPLPILMQRSPYGFGLAAAQRNFPTQFKELADEGFIFILQDIRGRFGSEGNFVMLRPAAIHRAQTDDSTDTYDSIDWAIKSLPHNNGKVGVFGVSYAGWAAAMATVNAHQALKAVSISIRRAAAPMILRTLSTFFAMF
ncbi:MAG: CocE/NonD family hydrolase [Rhodanobacter sp.]